MFWVGSLVDHVCTAENSLGTVWDQIDACVLLGCLVQDFAAAGYTWSKQLCDRDSDGDGFTNGMELGDPDCQVSESNRIFSKGLRQGSWLLAFYAVLE